METRTEFRCYYSFDHPRLESHIFYKRTGTRGKQGVYVYVCIFIEEIRIFEFKSTLVFDSSGY